MAERPQIGKRYVCKFDDCCIAGSFTATVTAVERDDDFVYRVEFDNGVVLTETLALQLAEAPA